jgi:hypothetical protein
MHLEHFVARHPRCVVGRPDWLTPSMAIAAALATALASALAALALIDELPAAALALAIVAAVAAALGSRRLSAAREALSRCLGGRACFAVADDELLLVDPAGSAVVVALDCISGLILAGDEPRLHTEQSQALVYAAMFALFDEGAAGPSGERFFTALAPRLRARCPHALVSRRDGCDDPLLVG